MRDLLRPTSRAGETRRSVVLTVLLASAALGGVVAVSRHDPEPTAASAILSPADIPATTPTSAAPLDSAVAPATTAAPAATEPSTPAATGGTEQDIDESTAVTGSGCALKVQSMRAGTSGSNVTCLQQALTSAGFYTGAINGQFDQATDAAVRQMQLSRDLFVDGVVGRETALSLGIWPDEAKLVIHTPKPPAGAKDSMGFPLSSVSSTGKNAPPLPENSGSGRRVVYDRAGQRVWAVAADGTIIRSWLVSGSKYGNEQPGTHQVYSRSEVSTAWNGKAFLPKMIRWLKTDIGAIGFHGIPTHVSDGSAYQTEAELGTRLSGGCQRQANPDAAFMWEFAQIGTKVVVV
jgi:peptidoglycan hydrolase-like protein with peptidoglycan-binding domain